MSKLICQKCGEEISNEFGVTLSFCTNCGAALSNFGEVETVELKRQTGKKKPPKNNILKGLILGTLMTLFLLGGFYFVYNYFQSQNETGSNKKSDSTSSPWIKLPKFNSVDASEISQITFSYWQHAGLLFSGDGYVDSTRITFDRAGNASRTVSKNYDDGKRQDEVKEYTAAISSEQFERLAKSVAENDFVNLTDSKERISESDKTLIIKYSGGQKEIKTSNIGKDTPEIQAILNEIIYVQSELTWNAAN